MAVVSLVLCLGSDQHHVLGNSRATAALVGLPGLDFCMPHFSQRKFLHLLLLFLREFRSDGATSGDVSSNADRLNRLLARQSRGWVQPTCASLVLKS